MRPGTDRHPLGRRDFGGIFNEKLLSAALAVVLVTVIIAGVVTKLAAARLESPEASPAE